MRKTTILLALFSLICLIGGAIFMNSSGSTEMTDFRNQNHIIHADGAVKDEIRRLYEEMQLENVINYKVFRQGVSGFNRIDSRKKEVLALIDFSKPSTEERLFILDLKKKEVLFTTHVSHGKKSGGNYATSFSNVNGSYQSSLGFYLTENTYQGKNGYSLVLEGLESGINDRAKERAIVMHGASYSNPSIIQSNGRLGRSLGCPSVPEALAKPIIDTLKGGAVLFIYADKKDYLKQSSFVW